MKPMNILPDDVSCTEDEEYPFIICPEMEMLGDRLNSDEKLASFYKRISEYNRGLAHLGENNLNKKSNNRKSLHEKMDNLSKPKSHRNLKRSKHWRNSRLNINGDGLHVDVDDSSDSCALEETDSYVNILKCQKRKNWILKTCLRFCLGALRFQGRLNHLWEERLTRKTQECAARLILHHIILNSWRNKQWELQCLTLENEESAKSMENLVLQLKIVRHIQSGEKKNMTEKLKIKEELRANIQTFEAENLFYAQSTDKLRNDLEKIKQALLQSEAENRKAINENRELTSRYNEMHQLLQDQKETTVRLGNENKELRAQEKDKKEKLVQVKKEAKERQEKCRLRELRICEVRKSLSDREKTIGELQSLKNTLNEELEELSRTMGQKELELKRKTEEAQNLSRKQSELNKSLQLAKDEIGTQKRYLLELETVSKNSEELKDLFESELVRNDLSNVRRRREWTKKLFFLTAIFYPS